MRERLFAAAVVLALGIGAGGCQCGGNRCCYPSYRPVGECGRYCTPQCPAGVLPPHPLTAVQSSPICGGCPAPAYGPAPAVPAAPVAPAVPAPQAVVPSSSLSSPASDWQPVGPAAAAPEQPREPVRLLAPEGPAQPAPGDSSAAPKPASPPDAPTVTEERAKVPTPEPPLALPPEPREAKKDQPEANLASPAFPVGIPQFAPVRDGVTSGLRPSLDGLDWLKDNGYRTALYVRAPGVDDSSDREQFKKRGITYLGLEVSPERLTRATVDEFSRIVGDKSNYPLFVYDQDGMLAGALWYLHFRTADRLADEAAKTKAAQHGLKADAAGEPKAMWLAIQKVLAAEAGTPAK